MFLRKFAKKKKKILEQNGVEEVWDIKHKIYLIYSGYK